MHGLPSLAKGSAPIREAAWRALVPVVCGCSICLCNRVQVQRNVQAAKEALGLLQSETQHAEDAVLKQVVDMLKPIKNMTWPSGRPKNNEVHV